MNDTVSAMRRRALRIAVLVWLGWYLSGPVCETFDFWDPPRAEVHDVKRNAGGYVTLVAAFFCFAVFLSRKFRERCSFVPTVIQFSLPSLSFWLPDFGIPATPASCHSPPLSPLRI